MSLQLQEELAPGDLQRKWTKLSQVSGGFRKVKDAVIAHQGGDQQLVLVAVAFGQATTNLFVILTQAVGSSTSTFPETSSDQQLICFVNRA